MAFFAFYESSPAPCLCTVFPASIAVINHQLAHSAVDDDILARDKPCAAVVAKKHHHVGDILRLADAPYGVLDFVCGTVFGYAAVPMIKCGFYPAGAYGIDARPPSEAYAQGVCEREDAALRRGVAFRVGLGLLRPRRSDIDDGGAFCEFIELTKHIN